MLTLTRLGQWPRSPPTILPQYTPPTTSLPYPIPVPRRILYYYNQYKMQVIIFLIIRTSYLEVFEIHISFKLTLAFRV